MLAESENKMMTLSFGGCGFQVGSQACNGCCPSYQHKEKEVKVGMRIFEIPSSSGEVVWDWATITSIDTETNTLVAVCQCCNEPFKVEIAHLELARHGVLLVPDFAMTRVDCQ